MTNNPAEVLVVHYQEVGLKGRNRSFFERTLANNIQAAVDPHGTARVETISGRILVHVQPNADLPAISAALVKVFGISSISPAKAVPATMKSFVATAVEMARQAHATSFRVRAKRGNTSFQETSQKINEVVGQAIKDATYMRVDLSNAEWTCHIECVANKGYIYSEKLPGPGGLPVGTSGKVLALLSGGIDSPVAAWKLAKRGSRVDFVHFHGQPFADPSSARQATKLAAHLASWIPGARLWMVQFGDIQSEIVTSAPQELRIVLYRRFMMRIAEAIATARGHQALVTGESLGQVASQTLTNMQVIDAAVSTMPVLRPLVGDDKLEIENMARRIETYEISIEPHQDCCVLFVPRRVTTGARMEQVLAAESRLDVEALVDKGASNAEEVPLPKR